MIYKMKHDTILMLIGTVANGIKCVQLVPQLLQNLYQYRRTKVLVSLDVCNEDELLSLYSECHGVNADFLILNNLSIALMIVYAAWATMDGVLVLWPSLVGNLFAFAVGIGLQVLHKWTSQVIHAHFNSLNSHPQQMPACLP